MFVCGFLFHVFILGCDFPFGTCISVCDFQFLCVYLICNFNLYVFTLAFLFQFCTANFSIVRFVVDVR